MKLLVRDLRFPLLSALRPPLSALMAAVLAASSACSASIPQDALFETLASRIVAIRVRASGGTNSVLASAANTAKTMGADGKWANIDYSDNNNSSWKPIAHLFNVEKLALAHAAGESSFHAALESSLSAWFAEFGTLQGGTDCERCKNWWQQLIGVPRQLGYILCAAGDVFSEETRAAALAQMNLANLESRANQCPVLTGQNRTYVSSAIALRGIAFRNAEDLATARDGFVQALEINHATNEEVTAKTGEGIRDDGSLHQHGNQPQFGGYGAELMGNNSIWVRVLDGSPWAYPPEALEPLRKMARSYAWLLRDGSLDPSSLDRQLTFNAAAHKGSYISGSIRNLGMELADPRGYHYFDLSALAVYRAPKFMASVKMSTPTIRGTEMINSENVHGCFMADGALYFTATGEEYKNVQALWRDKWHLIPGITSYVRTPEEMAVAKGDGPNGGWANGGCLHGSLVHTGFMDAGWVEGRIESDAEQRSLTYHFNRAGLRFTKNWKFTDRGVDVTVSDIAGEDDAREIVTCIEHANAARGETTETCLVSQTEERTILKNGATIYTIYAPPSAITYSITHRKSDWGETAPFFKHTPAEGDVLEIVLHHGPELTSARYSIEVK